MRQVNDSNREVIRSMMSDKGSYVEGKYLQDDGGCSPIGKVNIGGIVTWFINGRPLLTITEYKPCRMSFVVKMERGDGEDGERRKEYEEFVLDVLESLSIPVRPVFPSEPCPYTNEMSVTDNGYHPIDIVK